MGLFNRSEKRASLENPQISLSDPTAWKQILGEHGAAGVNVSPETAIKSTTVYSCVRLLSETLASLPLNIYRRSGRKKEVAYDHPAYWLLHDEPNENMSSFQWREAKQAKTLLWGNGYSEIERNGAGQPLALWPLDSSMTVVDMIDSRKFIKTRVDSKTVAIPDYDCLHVSGFGYTGLSGLNPVLTNKGAIGLSLAAEKFGQTLFENGVRASGVLEHPGELSDPAYERLKESFAKQYAGVKNSNKPILLEEGTKWSQMSMTPEDAQILELRKFQVAEVARIFNVPLHMIGDLDRATNNNIEQQSLEFLVYSIRSWLVRWEQELNRKLLARSERGQYFFKFNVDGLLRGDNKSRWESYRIAREIGAYSTNDILEKEDMNPVKHGDDDYVVPLNMRVVGEESQENGGQGDGEGKE
jgi:HK97 family phage portal protein